MTEERVLVKVIGAYRFKDESGTEWIYILLEDEAKQRMPIYVDQCAAWAVMQGQVRASELSDAAWPRGMSASA